MVSGASPDELQPFGVWEGTKLLFKVPSYNLLPSLGQAVLFPPSAVLPNPAFWLSLWYELARGTILTLGCDDASACTYSV